jgi:methionine-rich copper-binding protein CopC
MNKLLNKSNKKILAKVLLAAFVNLNFSSVVEAYAESWQSVGDAGFSSNGAYYTSMTIAKDGTPYVAYEDGGNDNKVTVMKYDGSEWTTVGKAGFSVDVAYYTSIAIDGDGTPYVAYEDGGNSNKVTVKKYDGKEWTTVGEVGFSESYAYSTSIAIDKDGTPYVAYQDGANSDKATVKKYDGNNWITVGEGGFSAGGANYTSIVLDKDGVPYVAYKDEGNNNKATVKKYDGNNWMTVGNEGFSGSYANFTSIAIDENGIPYVAYADVGNSNKATVKKYDGSKWTTVGDKAFSEGSITDTSIVIGRDGTPYVAYGDLGNNSKATVKKYDGTKWITVGESGFSASYAYFTRMAIGGDGTAYVTYTDGGNNYKATTMIYSTPMLQLSQTGPYTFIDEAEGYSSVTPESITIKKTGTEDITNLRLALSGTNAASFTLGELGTTTLDNTTTEAIFTIKPNDNLSAGTYTATVTVISAETVSESFDVSFTVTSCTETPSSIEITRDKDTLITELEKEGGNEFTTSAAVTYDWYSDDELIDGEHTNIYKLSNEDKGKNIKVKVEQYNLESHSFYVNEDEVEATTPAAVRIEGTEDVDNTLEDKLLAEDGTKTTTSSAATYDIE